jgi:peptidoglycan/LPS O-acetylase OafA/YrhL
MRRLGYVPALDGIRGIAILLVVGAHAFHLPPTGYLGVDLFFVLSGFLITTLLLEERAETGKVSLRSFYERRARRLLPALLMMLVAYTAVEFAQGRHPTLRILAGLFYFTNLGPLLHSGGTGPLGHLWSLAEEEQFYLLWPLLLIFLAARPRRVAPSIVVVLLGAVVVERILLVHSGVPSWRVMYAPDTRSDGLLVGCLFALVRHYGRGERLRIASGAIALVLAPFVTLFLFVDWRTRIIELGGLTILTLYFGLLVTAAADTPKNPLAWPPLAKLGVISYALYIWHFPLLYAFGLPIGAADHPWRRATVIALAVALAALSTRYIEQPIRRRRAYTLKVPVPASAQAVGSGAA